MITIKIAIVGPESTGKSSLALALSRHFNSPYVPEVARGYLENYGPNYRYEDLKKIARLQCQAEDQLLVNHPPLLFCDTTLMVIKIWSEYKYQRCDDWIIAEEKSRPYDLFLLTDIDLPWEQDPLREHPDKRKELFTEYYRYLIHSNRPFHIVFGSDQERTNRAIQVTKTYLNLK
ncbi:MAG: ATP-binding protein [Bacteroidetes bacterium]|nr:ATP-binding protein [Bacteroidota bacterium]MBL0095538.1 ATP-binding protein [Bacteroidota bacterium]